MEESASSQQPNSHVEHYPLVSVALMTYNRAHLLRGVIESWLAQTYPNFELIIADDASGDETQKIAEEYAAKDKRVRYFRQEKNQNAPGCYTFSLHQARGGYFMWAADDDLWDKRFLDDCMVILRNDPELVLAFAGMVDIDQNSDVIAKLNPATFFPFSKNLYERLKSYTLFNFSDGKNQLMFGVWKKEVLLDNPLFGYYEKDDHFPYYWGFTNFVIFRGLAKGPAGFVDQVRFSRRSRILETYRPPRWIVPRLAVTFYHRLSHVFPFMIYVRTPGDPKFQITHVFGSPYFWYIMRCIISQKELSSWQKVKLLGWNFFAMIRVLVVRKL